MSADITQVLGGPAEFQIGGAGIIALGGYGDGREIVMAVGQGEAIAEAAVGPELDFVTTEGDFGPGFSGSVNDQLRIDVEPEAFLDRGFAPKRARGTGEAETGDAKAET